MLGSTSGYLYLISKVLKVSAYLDGVWSGHWYRHLDWNRDWDMLLNWDRDGPGVNDWIRLGDRHGHWHWVWDRNWYLKIKSSSQCKIYTSKIPFAPIAK